MRHISEYDLGSTVWIKSSYSQGGNNCLEVAAGPTAVVPVRDSKNPHGPKLVFRAEAWSAFVENLGSLGA
ncbi:DUF397 domain-containing protein [Streptomyces sp. NPDC007971]|uniref:DUF397 domain-containing protein n=1 Tax=Streptomyces sp. NPDC007971 TaxID=3364799 RepID=UPI0036EB5CE9